MILLGIILLIIGIFIARNILWPIGAILLVIGLILLILTATGSGIGINTY